MSVIPVSSAPGTPDPPSELPPAPLGLGVNGVPTTKPVLWTVAANNLRGNSNSGATVVASRDEPLAQLVSTTRALQGERYPTLTDPLSESSTATSNTFAPVTELLDTGTLSTLPRSAPINSIPEPKLIPVPGSYSTNASALGGTIPISTPRDGNGNLLLSTNSQNLSTTIPTIQLPDSTTKPSSFPPPIYTRFELQSATNSGGVTERFSFSNNLSLGPLGSFQTTVTGDLRPGTKLSEPPSDLFNTPQPNFAFNQVRMTWSVLDAKIGPNASLRLGPDVRFRFDQSMRVGLSGSLEFGDPKANFVRLTGSFGANIFPDENGDPGGQAKAYFDAGIRFSVRPVSGFFSVLRVQDTSTTYEGGLAGDVNKTLRIGGYASVVDPDKGKSTVFAGASFAWQSPGGSSGLVAPGIFRLPGGEVTPGIVVKFNF